MSPLRLSHLNIKSKCYKNNKHFIITLWIWLLLYEQVEEEDKRYAKELKQIKLVDYDKPNSNPFNFCFITNRQFSMIINGLTGSNIQFKNSDKQNAKCKVISYWRGQREIEIGTITRGFPRNEEKELNVFIITIFLGGSRKTTKWLVSVYNH